MLSQTSIVTCAVVLPSGYAQYAELLEMPVRATESYPCRWTLMPICCTRKGILVNPPFPSLDTIYA